MKKYKLCIKTSHLLIAPTIGLLAFLTLYPLMHSFWVSLHTWVLSRPNIFPFVGLANYHELFFDDPLFLQTLKNTFIVLAVGLTVEFGFGLLLALILNQRDLIGVTIFRVIFVIPMIVMPIVVGVLWKFLLHPSYGIFNFFITKIGMKAQAWIANPKLALLTVIGVDVWEWTPFVVLILYSGLVSLPIEPYEAATIDGASSWQRFRYLTLPLMKPIMVIVIIMRMIDLIELFDIVFVLTRGGPGNSTMVLTLYNFRMGLNYFNMGKATALSWVILIIVLILTQIYIRVTKSQFIRR